MPDARWVCPAKARGARLQKNNQTAVIAAVLQFSLPAVFHDCTAFVAKMTPSILKKIQRMLINVPYNGFSYTAFCISFSWTRLSCCVYKAVVNPRRIFLLGYAPPLSNSCSLLHARLKKGDENKGKHNLESMAEHKLPPEKNFHESKTGSVHNAAHYDLVLRVYT